MKLYNTLTRKKETFKLSKHKIVELFVCGPTVYDFTHLGHARTYVAFDMIVKYLRGKGYNVFYLQNITDIDDKIIQRAKENKASPKEWARRFEKEYLQDMKSLKIDSVTKYARATEHIKEVITQVKKLKSKGFAYQIKDGIYYDIKKFKDYGKLSRRTVLRAEDAVSRIDESKEKKNRGDFALWKFSKAGGPKWKWPAPSGRGSPRHMAGRPGWHIEDTAIAEKYFGTQYDMHGGGRDLIFPHHEAEIAQMEAISDKSPMVKYWLHTGFLTVNGQKMSKSLGNFVTVKDFIKKHSRPRGGRGSLKAAARLLRFLVLKNHYRSPIDYNESAVIQAKRELERIDEFVDRLVDLRLQQGLLKSEINSFQKEFKKAMEDDFNTPEAVAVIFGLTSQGNMLMDKDLLNRDDAKNILEFFKEIDSFLNFIFWPRPKAKPPKELLNLVKQREGYRQQEKWQKADEIRKKFIKLGWWVEDTKQGPKLKKM